MCCSISMSFGVCFSLMLFFTVIFICDVLYVVMLVLWYKKKTNAIIAFSVGQGGWPVQTQMQRNFSEWWERSSYSGPNPTWVFWFLLVFLLDIVTCLLVAIYHFFCVNSFYRILKGRSRTLWWWMRLTTCPFWLLTVRARWARWEGTCRRVDNLNSLLFIKLFYSLTPYNITSFIFH